jgi:hypothetical protein
MSTINISFPARVNTLSFEVLLRQYLPRTRERATDEVTFDFSAVQWFELFELSLIVIWIDELVTRGKKVAFTYPICDATPLESSQKILDRAIKRSIVCSYLNRWDFDDFLRNRGVEVFGHGQKYPYWPDEPEQQSLLPFHLFDSDKDFSSFLINLRDEQQFELVFKDTSSLAIVGSRGIRDTIISEIGQNIYDHADGRCALITIGTIGSLIDNTLAKARYNYSSPLEKTFIRNLGYSGYLQVIIADAGAGIFRRLKNEYCNDLSVSSEERTRPTESHVLNYAFKIDTTSKPKQTIPFQEDEDPGRGLFWVREIARRNKAFLSVRSGASIIAYDFLTGDQNKPYWSNQDFPEIKSLAKLGGTQIKLYFPLNPDLIQVRTTLRSSRSVVTAAVQGFVSKVIEIRNYSSANNQWTTASLENVIKDLLRPQHESRQQTVNVLDFAGTKWDKDALFPLLLRFAEQQHAGVLIVALNIVHDSQIFEIASEILAEKIEANSLKLRPILVIKPVGFDLLGLPQTGRRVVQRFFSEQSDEVISEVEVEEFCSRYDHLFAYDHQTHRPIVRISLAEVNQSLTNSYRELIGSLALDESNGVFFQGKFLLPSNCYVDGYFRVTTLLAYESASRQLEHVFTESLTRRGAPIDAILTISSDVRELGYQASQRLSHFYSTTVQHLHLNDARNRDSNAGILFTRLRGKTISILTSVIGTGRSLTSVLTLCEVPGYDISVFEILSIIDSRDSTAASEEDRELNVNEFECNGHKYPLSAVLRHPLHFYFAKPLSWRVEDIRRIDPESNAPTPDAPQAAVRPLWKPVDGFFFDNLMRNARALNVGHYRRRHRHYVHFIDMLRLANHFGPDIATTIKKDVHAICGVSAMGAANVTHVLFDAESRGALIAAGYIASQFQSTPISMQQLRKERPEVQKSIENSDIVIYESAVSSGVHLQRLIDSVSDLKPRRIFAYTILQRRESDAVRFYQKIDSYAGIELRIRYFVEIEIPPYTVWDCPICNRLEELRELSVYCEDALLRDFISDELEALAIEDIHHDTAVKQPGRAETTEIVRQAILRRKLGASKTDHIPRYPLTELIENHSEQPDEALRLLEVMAKEISVLETYSELFYPSFKRHIVEACISFLEDPNDLGNRERSAIIILRAISPEFFVNDLVPIFRGVSHDRSLTFYLFVELLILIMKGGNVEKIREALALCQQSLEEDEHFVSLPVEDIAVLEHLLNYVRRKLRIQLYRDQIEKGFEPLATIPALWSAFVERPGRVHPKLVQDFPKVIGIYSVEKFNDAFSNYIGLGNFSDLMDKAIPLFERFTDCLRPQTKTQLTYFLSNGEGTFSGDYELLDDSLTTLSTLRSQGRLTPEEFAKVFFNNSLVNSAIQRLRVYAFQEKTSIIRRVLTEKFADTHTAIRKCLRDWDGRFAAARIHWEYFDRQCHAFIPEDVLVGVIDGCLQNIVDYAFTPDSKTRKVKIAADQQVGELIITICDSGRGITEDDINRRPNGGLRRSKTLLALYGASLQTTDATPDLSFEGFVTVIQIKLLTKEKVIWSDNSF